MFTLKVIEDAETGRFYADTAHEYGGYDMLQAHAFAHLFPGGECPWVFRELVFSLAATHGWEVEVREADNPDETTEVSTDKGMGLLGKLETWLKSAEVRHNEELADGDSVSVASTRATFLAIRDAIKLARETLN